MKNYENIFYFYEGNCRCLSPGKNYSRFRVPLFGGSLHKSILPERSLMKLLVSLIVLTTIFIFSTSVRASGPVPATSVGNGYHASTPESACQAQIDLGFYNISPGDILYVTSYAGGWIDGAVPYYTSNLSGWQCNAKSWTYSPNSHQWYWVVRNLGWMYPVCPAAYTSYPRGAMTCPSIAQYFVVTQAEQKSDNGSCCSASVGDPINAVNGNTFKSEGDFVSKRGLDAIPFNRFYNSADSTKYDLSAGWRHSFSRALTFNYNSAVYMPYISGNSSYSSLYNDEATACTSGFSQIKSQVPNWVAATASFNNGSCRLTKNGVDIGALPVLSKYAELPPPSTTAISLSAIRDDGRVVQFTNQGGTFIAPPSITLKLQQTSSGYTLTDANGNVETYNSNGKLLSVTSRTGVIQTMSYDSAGRLSGVTDNFGHILTLSYDSQGRLSSVTR